jgi:hypothetical protein
MRIRLSWARETLVSASLGHRLTDKLALATFHARIAVARALDRPLPGPLTARLAPDSHEVVISDPGELSVLHDVIVKREYQPRGYPEVIFDVGANAGFATLFFKRSFPSARILCVEAAPRTLRTLAAERGWPARRRDDSSRRCRSRWRGDLLLVGLQHHLVASPAVRS